MQPQTAFHKKSPAKPGTDWQKKSYLNTRDAMKGPQPLHFLSAGGGVYGAEERLKAVSYIIFWP